MHKKSIAIAVTTLFLELAQAQNSAQLIQYFNTAADALAACQSYAQTTLIPGQCGGGSGQYPEVTSYVCTGSQSSLQSGINQYVTNVTNSKWTGITCPPTGLTVVHFAFPTTACAGSAIFEGPGAADCVSQSFSDLVAATSVQLGAEAAACQAGNPCDAATGNKFESQVDFVGGSGVPSFTRYYNSLSTTTVGLGVGWNHSYSKRIEVVQPGNKINVIRDDGRLESFTLTGGVWVGSPYSKLAVTQSVAGGSYTVRLQDGTTEVYGFAGGQLVSETDPWGRTTTFTYSGGSLSQVTGPYGHTLKFTWLNGPNRISKVTLPDGKQIAFTQSAALNLTQVQYPNSTTKKYLYENTTYLHALTGVVDELNVQYATFSFDADGKAASTEHAGATQKFGFAYSGTSTAVSLNQAPYFSASFTTNAGIKRLMSKTWAADNSSVQQTWDSNNNLLSRTNELGQTTSFSWDALNRLSSTTDAAGKVTSYTYLGSLALPLTITSPSVASGQSAVTSISYDSANRPLGVTHSGFTPSGSPVSRSTSLTWTAAGQVASVTDARNNVTSMTYWSGTTDGSNGQLKTVTNALGQVTNFNSYDLNGRLTKETSASGVVTQYTYDTMGRLTVVDSTNGAIFNKTNYAYNAIGLVSSVTFVATKGTPDTGSTLTYGYDAAHRLTSVTDNLGNKVVYGYDSNNNQTLQEVRDSSNTLVRQIQNSFDARNRLSSINAAGSVSQLFYDFASQVTSTTDPNNQTSSFQYDLIGRLTKQINAMSGATQAGYNVKDAPTSITAPNGANTTYSVDDLGNRLNEVSPDRGTTTYAVDANGNVTARTDARGITASYSYDALNRILTTTYPQQGESVSFSYDSCRVGKLCTVSDAYGTWSYSYDGLDRLSTSAWTANGHTYTTSYTWTPLNAVATLTYPSGRTVSYSRNVLGKVTSVASNGQPSHPTEPTAPTAC